MHTGLVLTMIGAITLHIRRGEYAHLVTNIILMAPALLVVYGRFVSVPL